MPVSQTWQLIADPEAQQHWLGPGAVLKPVSGARVQLNHEAGMWRSGTVTAVADEQRIECELAPAPAWVGIREPTKLTITIESHPKGGSRVKVEESGSPVAREGSPPHADSQSFWSAALKRLGQLARDVNRRRGRPRQAIIVIHGIGEQQPGVTLRNFVAGALRVGSSGPRGWSKPDTTSRNFDLRRVTLEAGQRQRRPTTDVFELYWAHMIRDTTLSQVASWLQHLLFRWPVPRRFLPLWLAAWTAVATVVGFVAARAAGYSPEWLAVALKGGVLALVATAAWRLLGKSFVLDSLGDAARYLSPRPANIEHRQAIREAGVDLLAALHAQGRFDRIVIVGHSLGSVIAYDVITHFWIRIHREHLRMPKVDNTGITAVERALGETDPEKAQDRQHEAWKKLRSNSQPWLITDLVTVGSPLSAADFLMAPTAAGLRRAMDDREYPSCPPIHETSGDKKRVSYSVSYEDRFGRPDRTIMILHHAAPFAVTRWTNLYFKSSLLKDPVGGPVAPQLGRWIRDMELNAPAGRRFFLHTWYWRGKGREKKQDRHLRELFKALHLDAGSELLAELKKHSPLMYMPRSGPPP